MAVWLAVVASAIGCYTVKVAGTLVPQRVLERPAVRAAVAQVPVALLASLVAVQTLTGGGLVADARLVGLAVAGLAVWRRAPFLVVVLAAATATALARLLLGLP